MHGCFRHRRSGGGPPPGFAPVVGGFFNEPSLSVMLRQELGLVLHDLGGMGLECFGNLRMQLLPSAPQQTTVNGILHQSVLETVDRLGRRAALEDQL